MRPVSYVSCMRCNADLTKEGSKRKRCAGCHSVFYDDVSCQKKDWAIHKTECKALQRRFIAAVRPKYPEVDTITKVLARPEACSIIAQNYFYGKGRFERNRGLAVFWMTQWMKGGDVEAVALLGLCYTGEVGLRKYKEGVKLLRRASEDNKTADDLRILVQHELGNCYSYGREGLVVQINKREAAKWYRLAAEGGHAESQGQLGDMLEFGEGVEKDIEEAMVWYRKAAEQGDARAQVKYGSHFVGPECAEGRDANEAVKWFRRAAEQGDVHAEYTLGKCLTGSFGLAKKDSVEAVFWFRKSADQGHAPAQYEVHIQTCACSVASTRSLPPTDVWCAQPLRPLSSAFAPTVTLTNADIPSHLLPLIRHFHFQLGVSYLHGDGVASDHYEAIRLFRLSADQDNDPARAALLALGFSSTK